MVFATALKRRLGASAAGAVGFEWFELKGLEFVSWEEELAAAAVDALRFSALEAGVEWKEYTAPPTRGPARIHGPLSAMLGAQCAIRTESVGCWVAVRRSTGTRSSERGSCTA